MTGPAAFPSKSSLESFIGLHSDASSGKLLMYNTKNYRISFYLAHDLVLATCLRALRFRVLVWYSKFDCLNTKPRKHAYD